MLSAARRKGLEADELLKLASNHIKKQDELIICQTKHIRDFVGIYKEIYETAGETWPLPEDHYYDPNYTGITYPESGGECHH